MEKYKNTIDGSKYNVIQIIPVLKPLVGVFIYKKEDMKSEKDLFDIIEIYSIELIEYEEFGRSQNGIYWDDTFDGFKACEYNENFIGYAKDEFDAICKFNLGEMKKIKINYRENKLM